MPIVEEKTSKQETVATVMSSDMPSSVAGPGPVSEAKPVDVEAEVVRRVNEARKVIYNQVLQDLQTQYDTELLKTRNDLQAQNKQAMEQAIAEFKKEQTPPTHEEIQKMLDAEYLNFKTTIRWRSAADSPETDAIEEITISELPQAAERRLIKMLKDKVQPVLSQIAPMLIGVLQGDKEDKVTSLLSLIDPATDALRDLTAGILTEHTGRKITPERVENSLSSTRQMSIVTAQLDANRVRDFFSRAVRISKA